MDEATALHTAARRYCESVLFHWTWSGARFAEETLVEIEKLVPAQFQSMEDLRASLLRAGEVTLEKFAGSYAETKKAAADYAGRYRAYIMGVTRSDLASIEPLPYRRTLDEDERRRLFNGLKQHWDLHKVENCINMLNFHNDLFEAKNGLQILRDALTRRGISKVLQFNEISPDVEIDVSIFDPRSWKAYSTSHEFDWLVYSSHESSIAIGGEWLMEAFEKQWLDWRDITYRGPFSTPDLRGQVFPVMKVVCHVETDLSFDEFAATFAHSEWRPNIGRYALSLTSPLGERKFVRSDDGYLLEDSIEAFDMESAARSLSAQLSSQGLRHKLEVYDAGNKMMFYLRHDPPGGG
jgi:hypothetical protein